MTPIDCGESGTLIVTNDSEVVHLAQTVEDCCDEVTVPLERLPTLIRQLQFVEARKAP